MIKAVIAAGACVAVAGTMLFTAAPDSGSKSRQTGGYYIRLAEHAVGVKPVQTDNLTGYRHEAHLEDGYSIFATSRPKEQPEGRRFTDGKGLIIITNDEVRVRSTFSGVGGGVDNHPLPERDCGAYPDGSLQKPGSRIGEERIFGYRTVIFQESPTPEQRFTIWLSPELGCRLLQATSEVRANPADPWRLVAYVRPDDITSNSVPAWLRTLPRDYREMSPGEAAGLAIMKNFRSKGIPADDPRVNMAMTQARRQTARADEIYASNPARGANPPR
jgi:hypothetical protein